MLTYTSSLSDRRSFASAEEKESVPEAGCTFRPVQAMTASANTRNTSDISARRIQGMRTFLYSRGGFSALTLRSPGFSASARLPKRRGFSAGGAGSAASSRVFAAGAGGSGAARFRRILLAGFSSCGGSWPSALC